jgi:hypothetical protein
VRQGSKGEERKVISAKVATITSDSEIAVNVGATAGVSKGSIVRLFRSVEILDPDTNEKLGGVRYPRASFVVTLVSEKYSVATVRDRSEGTVWSPVPALKKLTGEEGVDQDQWVYVRPGMDCEVSPADPEKPNSGEPPF